MKKFLRIYGTITDDLDNGKKKIVLYAIGYGIQSDSCRKVPNRKIIVKGYGKPAECNGVKLADNIKVWLVQEDESIETEIGENISLTELLYNLYPDK